MTGSRSAPRAGCRVTPESRPPPDDDGSVSACCRQGFDRGSIQGPIRVRSMIDPAGAAKSLELSLAMQNGCVRQAPRERAPRRHASSFSTPDTAMTRSAAWHAWPSMSRILALCPP